jgi:uncharacterized cupin superfamily protein
MTDDDSLVVSVDDVAPTTEEHGDHEFERRHLGAVTDGEDIGASVYEVAPGKKLWLRHYHTANEEALFVLDGEGTLTLGPDDEATEHHLEAGVYAALPADERGLHEIEAGEELLRLLMVSTMDDPDVLHYPDEGKIGVYVGSAPGDHEGRTFSKFFEADSDVPYWDDE